MIPPDPDRSVIEFLDADPGPGTEEVLGEAPLRGRRHRVIVLLATLAVVLAGLAAARAGRGAGSAPASSAPAARPTPAPTPSWGMPSAEPTLSTAPPVGGPSDVPVPDRCVLAACIVVDGVLDSQQRAVHDAFPQARIQEGYTVYAEDFRSVRSRQIRARLGGSDLVVDVGAAPLVRRLTVSTERSRRLVRAVVRVGRFRVTVSTSDLRAPLRRIEQLALDPRMLAIR